MRRRGLVEYGHVAVRLDELDGQLDFGQLFGRSGKVRFGSLVLEKTGYYQARARVDSDGAVWSQWRSLTVGRPVAASVKRTTPVVKPASRPAAVSKAVSVESNHGQSPIETSPSESVPARRPILKKPAVEKSVPAVNRLKVQPTTD